MKGEEKMNLNLTRTKKVSIIVLLALLLTLTPFMGLVRAEEPTNVYLGDNGWSDPAVGTWDPVTITATLSQDINGGTLSIGSNIVLDGGGFKVTGFPNNYAAVIITANNVHLSNLVVDANNALIGVYIGGQDVTVEHCSLIWSRGAKRVSYTSYSTELVIKDNFITGFQYTGVILTYSSNNNIEGNTLTENCQGYSYGDIYLYESNFNEIRNNIITTVTNGEIGVRIGGSSNNLVISNTIINENGNDFTGIYLYQGRYDSDPNNNVIMENTISSSSALRTGYGIIISGLVIQTFNYVSNQKIEGNLISNLNRGIFCTIAASNLITRNTISNCQIGFELSSTKDNSIYNNNFLDNLQQVYADYSTNNNIFNLKPSHWRKLL